MSSRIFPQTLSKIYALVVLTAKGQRGGRDTESPIEIRRLVIAL
jgi:hypothetical protein